MTLNRRNFLGFLSGTAGAIALHSLQSCVPNPPQTSLKNAKKRLFTPIKGPMPLATDGLSIAQQLEAYQTYEVVDDLVLPEGFEYQIVATWGDKVGDSRFGYNNDYVSFVETGQNEGYLTVNLNLLAKFPGNKRTNRSSENPCHLTR